MGEGPETTSSSYVAAGACTSPVRRSPPRHKVIDVERETARLVHVDYHPRKPPLQHQTSQSCSFARRHGAWITLTVGLGLMLLLSYPRERPVTASTTTKLLADEDPGSKNRFECVRDVTYLDYGSTFPGFSKRQCANLCYAMPNCRVWSLTPEDDCVVRYGNSTAMPKPGVTSCLQLSHRDVDMSQFLGVAHWQGCYFKTNKPFLLDGADTIREIGARVIKVSFNFHAPWDDYPWHSSWPVDEWKTWTPEPVEVAKHPYFRELFQMEGLDTYVLIAYSNVARSTGRDEWRAWLDPWYWVYKEPTAAQLKDETDQFYRLAEHLLTAYSGKTFILQMWEGDWTLRQDLQVEQRYNVSAPVSREKTDRMVRWLEARQKGVTLARKAVGSKATSRVYHAAEVNLVKKTLDDLASQGHTDRNDMVTSVLPRVALDMVSYSSYDTAVFEGSSTAAFMDALELIKRSHRRTSASPANPVFVGEFGVSSMNTNWDDTMERIKSAVNTAVAAGMRHLIYWQVYDNSLNPVGKQHYGVDRCDGRMLDKGPVDDQRYIEGFFLIHPDLDARLPPVTYVTKMLRKEWNA